MRLAHDVEDFGRRIRVRIISSCKDCKNGSNPECKCRAQVHWKERLYESCIPHDFWDMNFEDVEFNTEIYEEILKKYISKLNVAMRYGYGLLFTGDNGVGKTTFLSLVLKEALRRGASVYYTTLPDLVYQINKGMRDRSIAQRLEWYLTSDFLAIDEVGKDKVKNKFFAAEFHFERILKTRFDASTPTLLASNIGLKEIRGEYGKTVHSMLQGKYQAIQMREGDYRSKLRERMCRAMEYDI